MKIFNVQDTNNDVGKAGAVSAVINPEDAYDAEALLLGFAPGKSYLATGIGRHGNFLQWGWSAPPSKMTPAGKNLFINSICYIQKFNGVTPIIRDRALTRSRFLSSLKYATRDPAGADYYFSPETIEKYKNSLPDLIPIYSENINLLYQKGKHYFIDQELKSLGFTNNHEIANLPKLIALLDDNDQTETALRLLNRYTAKTFQTTKEWQTWFDKNRNRIIFSQTGGYKFYVIPKPK